jgi:hypothetical protein
MHGRREEKPGPLIIFTNKFNYFVPDHGRSPVFFFDRGGKCLFGINGNGQDPNKYPPICDGIIHADRQEFELLLPVDRSRRRYRPNGVSLPNTARKIGNGAFEIEASGRSPRISESSLKFSESSRRISESSRRNSESSRRNSESSRRLPVTPGKTPRALGKTPRALGKTPRALGELKRALGFHRIAS